jgi:hypothetical protein
MLFILEIVAPGVGIMHYPFYNLCRVILMHDGSGDPRNAYAYTYCLN